jgi:hypothetical protein
MVLSIFFATAVAPIIAIGQVIQTSCIVHRETQQGYHQPHGDLVMGPLRFPAAPCRSSQADGPRRPQASDDNDLCCDGPRYGLQRAGKPGPYEQLTHRSSILASVSSRSLIFLALSLLQKDSYDDAQRARMDDLRRVAAYFLLSLSWQPVRQRRVPAAVPVEQASRPSRAPRPPDEDDMA